MVVELVEDAVRGVSILWMLRAEGRAGGVLGNHKHQDTRIAGEEVCGTEVAGEEDIESGNEDEETAHDDGVPGRVRLKPALEWECVTADSLHLHSLPELDVGDTKGQPIEETADGRLEEHH